MFWNARLEPRRWHRVEMARQQWGGDQEQKSHAMSQCRVLWRESQAMTRRTAGKAHSRMRRDKTHSRASESMGGVNASDSQRSMTRARQGLGSSVSRPSAETLERLSPEVLPEPVSGGQWMLLLLSLIIAFTHPHFKVRNTSTLAAETPSDK